MEIGRTHMTIGETLGPGPGLDRQPEPPGRRARRPARERQAHRAGGSRRDRRGIWAAHHRSGVAGSGGCARQRRRWRLNRSRPQVAGRRLSPDRAPARRPCPRRRSSGRRPCDLRPATALKTHGSAAEYAGRPGPSEPSLKMKARLSIAAMCGWPAFLFRCSDAFAKPTGPGENTPLKLPVQTTQSAAASTSGGSLVRTIVGLAIVIGRDLRRLLGAQAGQGRPRGARHAAAAWPAIATLPLGPNRSLHLVRAGREFVLVGVARARRHADPHLQRGRGARRRPARPTPDDGRRPTPPAPAAQPRRGGLLKDVVEELRKRTVREVTIRPAAATPSRSSCSSPGSRWSRRCCSRSRASPAS